MLNVLVALPMPLNWVPAPIPTAPPELIWADVTRLVINDTYQRDLSPKSLKLIKNIAQHFDWRKFKPPIAVALTGDNHGYFEIIDGQHTTLGVLTRGDIPTIPVLVISAAEVTLRAQSFIGHNRDRIAMSPLALFNAVAVAGDEDARTVLQVCASAGITIPRQIPGNGSFKVNDTCAITTLRNLVKSRTAQRAVTVLQICAAAEQAPLTRDLIRAVDLLLHHADYMTIDHDSLIAMVKREYEFDTEIDQLVFAKGLPRWRALAAVLYNRSKKRKVAA